MIAQFLVSLPTLLHHTHTHTVPGVTKKGIKSSSQGCRHAGQEWGAIPTILDTISDPSEIPWKLGKGAKKSLWGLLHFFFPLLPSPLPPCTEDNSNILRAVAEKQRESTPKVLKLFATTAHLPAFSKKHKRHEEQWWKGDRKLLITPSLPILTRLASLNNYVQAPSMLNSCLEKALPTGLNPHCCKTCNCP